MVKATRITLWVFALAILPLNISAWAQQRPPLAEEVAKTFGLDSFNQIEGIRYTFNIEAGGKLAVSRSWTWEPKADRVSFDGKDKAGKPVKVTYVRSQLSSQPDSVKSEVDPSFVNDQYWLLFPLHVVWDTSAKVEDKGKQKLPLGKGSAEELVVTYPTELGGYTPGDTWTLFVGPDKRVQQFVYHRGGSVKPSVVIAAWTDYKKAGPLLIALDHRGTADGKPVRVFFSNVSVKLAGSDNWTNVQ
jgi:hypothetical protein